ncbi:MAG: hypothetical protein ACREX0_08170 [Noviherbaspirillum sp.]
MYPNFSIVAGTPLHALRLAALACLPVTAHATDAFATADIVTRRLPDLQGLDARPAQFGLIEQSATLGYQDRLEKWGAKLDQYLRPNAAVTFDYGRALTNTFGAGGSFTHQNEKSEVVLNGIYAPKKNVRIRLTGAQLRADGSYFAHANGPSESFLQNSYLFGARKYWNKYEYLSDLGLTAYSVEGNSTSSTTLPGLDDPDALHAAAPQNTLAAGRLDGYLLNLNLRPTADSNLELRHEQSHSTYYVGTRSTRDDYLGLNRITYSQHFDDCVRLHGGYSSSPDTDRIDLRLSRKNWNLQLSRQQGSSNSDTAIRIGYTLPLDRAEYRRYGCSGKPYHAPNFEPLVDAAAKRPQQVPREPLAIIQAQ